MLPTPLELSKNAFQSTKSSFHIALYYFLCIVWKDCLPFPKHHALRHVGKMKQHTLRFFLFPNVLDRWIVLKYIQIFFCLMKVHGATSQHCLWSFNDLKGKEKLLLALPTLQWCSAMRSWVVIAPARCVACMAYLCYLQVLLARL